MEANGCVAVLCGGCSTEREVSLISGRNVYEGLIEEGISATYLDITETRDIKQTVSSFESVFIMLHGGDGEGGGVQEQLETLGIPYTGSGPQASSLGMDKLATKALLEAEGISVPSFVSATDADIDIVVEQVLERLGLPVVVKAVGHGASLGIRPAASRIQLLNALQSLRKEYGSVFVEEFLHGREFSVPILRLDGEDVALPIAEILIQTEFNDFVTKYTSDLHETIVPAKLDAGVAKEISRIAVMTHKVMGCWGFSRVDIMLGNGDIPEVLEINTIPGMTPQSIMPQSASAIGIQYSRLAVHMLRTAFDRKYEQ